MPKAYRQRFQDAKCQDIQTYVEFKETLLNRWCASQKVGNSFDKLRQLMLLEEFKQCIPIPIKTYLEEQKVTELQKAASLADDYKLIHKSLTTVVEPKGMKTVDFPRSEQRGLSNYWFRPTCAYFKKRGHLMSKCWILEKKDRKRVTSKGVKPMNSISSSNTLHSYQPFISSSFCQFRRIVCPYLSQSFMLLEHRSHY